MCLNYSEELVLSTIAQEVYHLISTLSNDCYSQSFKYVLAVKIILIRLIYIKITELVQKTQLEVKFFAAPFQWQKVTLSFQAVIVSAKCNLEYTTPRNCIH